MSLVLLRHGPTRYNSTDASERIRGWLDVPLTPGGVRLAHLAADRFRGLPISHIYSSDLTRAAETARIWAATAGIPFSLHKELRPWGLGDIQGQVIGDAQPRIDDLVAHPSMPAPGGGESFDQFLGRYLPFILPLLDAPTQMHGAVSHIRNIMALEATLAAGRHGIDLQTWHSAPRVQPGQAAYFVTESPGKVLSSPPQEPAYAQSH